MVEHSTADREVPSSNLGAPFTIDYFELSFFAKFENHKTTVGQVYFFPGGCSSVVEHSTADREVLGSIPSTP